MSSNIRFQLTCLYTSLVHECLRIVAEPAHNLGQIIVEFASDFKVRNDLFVFEISVFQILQCRLALLGRRIALVCPCEVAVGFPHLLQQLFLIPAFLSKHLAIGIIKT